MLLGVLAFAGVQLRERGYFDNEEEYDQEMDAEFAGRDIWVVILTSGLVAAMLLDDREIGRRVGATMVVGYLSIRWSCRVGVRMLELPQPPRALQRAVLP